MYTVEYGLLPNFHNLFLDYVSFDEDTLKKVNKFYNDDYRKDDGLLNVLKQKAYTYNTSRYFDKNTLIDILKRQNVTFGGGEQTASNLEKLKKDNTFSIVTGQQVCLYTGALYTILKTVTAIKLANDMNGKYPDHNFVPIFWLESDDHDFEEMNHIHIINKDNNISRIGFADGTIEQTEDEIIRRESKPVGSIEFTDEINSLNESLKENLITTEFTEKLLKTIGSIYRSGNNFKTAFAQMMNHIFRDYGLIFIDPSDQEIKKLLIPIFEKELNTTPVLCEKIINVSADIEKHYDLQVKPKVINMFFLHNGNRQLIEPRNGNMFAIKNTKKRFNREDLTRVLYDYPEFFSPNVILRPICQDYLLPTAMYVGGPAEVSYFAQFKPAYEHYELTMPLIYPRASVTMVENRVNKFMKKYNIEFHDIFNHRVIVSKVVDSVSSVRIDDEIAKAIDEINGTFYRLKQITEEIDKTLVSPIDNMKSKLENNLEIFKTRLTNAMAKKSEVITGQIEKVMNNIYPERNLQERYVNVTYYLNKYDDYFIKKLFDEIDIYNLNHQVIDL